MNLQSGNRDTDAENKRMDAKWEGEEQMNWEIGIDIHTMSVCMLSLLCSTLCNPMDCSPSGSSVCGSLQARILEWVDMLSSS